MTESMKILRLNRREFCLGAVAMPLGGPLFAAEGQFGLRYILGSSMYGKTGLEQVLPEVRRTGAEHIDIWPLVHGNQREQIAEMGIDRFTSLLGEHRVRLGMFTRYDLGPFKLQEEMKVLKRLGGSMIICGAKGPAKLKAHELKSAVRQFVEKMKPHIAVAEDLGITIGIENHANNLIETPDSIRWFGDMVSSNNIGIALAPYHLEQNSNLIAGLIRDLEDRLVHFYAWQYGMGCHTKLPKEQELLQMPGRGSLDLVPIVQALRDINYKGWTEIFMHPVPRGVPILPSVESVTTEINRSRSYLEDCLRETGPQNRKDRRMDKVLIIVGEATETVDTLYPYFRLREGGFEPVVAGPEKRRYHMVLHEIPPDWDGHVTREFEGYTIQADVAFKDIDPGEYLGIFFSGGRAPEYIRYDKDLVRITKHFFEANKPIGCVCHGVEIPAYAGCVKGRRMATVPKCRFDLEVCGGTFVNEPCVVDGNLVSGRTFHDHGHYMGAWIKLLNEARGRSG